MNDNEILLAKLKKASPPEIRQHVDMTRDRLHAHKAATTWLMFVASNLPQENIQLEANDAFLGYLTDVDHPTAMPTYTFERRGVQ